MTEHERPLYEWEWTLFLKRKPQVFSVRKVEMKRPVNEWSEWSEDEKRNPK